MRKCFDQDNTIFYKLLFPQNKKTSPSLKKNSVVVGIGGNIGNTYWIFKKVFNYFRANSKIKIISSSPILQNPPFGFLEQNKFLNAILILNTSMLVGELLKYILNIEKRLGRKRSFKNAPRIIDIDLILFKNQKINKKNLIVPHRDWKNRLSILIPLNLS